MEELLALVELDKTKPARFSPEEQAWLKQSSAGARYYAKSRGIL
jgi:putative methionine-R-sulfoxide reductase with GAF domain